MHESNDRAVIPQDQIAGPPLGIIQDPEIRKQMAKSETVKAIKLANGITKAGQTSFVAARRLQGYSENVAKQNGRRPRRRRGKRQERKQRVQV